MARSWRDRRGGGRAIYLALAAALVAVAFLVVARHDA
jgi:hypothetical protein